MLISGKLKPTSISDLSIETVIPIDQYFSCGKCGWYLKRLKSYHGITFTDTEPIEGNQVNIIFIVSYKKVRYYFKIAIGIESSNFASEVIRSKEGKIMFSLNKCIVLRGSNEIFCSTIKQFKLF